eukprot:CAMPEP_0172644178 /NCGR_PEP_ID=MMETSP1068-20121228/239078_1 /TAXON_ID=35684 /ORGANISM="Pseudopedinella elastica, Strain CCMP716" /LENGTH=52 /DNA_ID=CAMNT_0013458369 /DNA_START=844 /DNA_END=1002 /DNA_ORIENTATION=+
MRTTSLRPTEIGVVQERTDEEEPVAPYFNRLTWGMILNENLPKSHAESFRGH